MPDSPYWRLVAFACSVLPGVLVTLILFRLGQRRLALRLFGVAVSSGAMIALVPALLSIFEKAVLVQMSLLANSLLASFVFAGLMEEATKLAAVLIIVRPHFACRSGRDLVLATAGVALGFALFENALKILSGPGGWELIAFRRAIGAIPVHVLIGLYLGYGVAKAEGATGRTRYIGAILKTLLVAAFLHGLYDLPLFLGSQAPLFPTLINQLATLFHLDTPALLAWMQLVAIILICFGAFKAISLLAMPPSANDPIRLSRLASRPNWFASFVFAPVTGAIAAILLFLVAAGFLWLCLEASRAGAITSITLLGAHAAVLLATLACCLLASFPSRDMESNSVTVARGTPNLLHRYGQRGRAAGICLALTITAAGLLVLFPPRSALALILVSSAQTHKSDGGLEQAIKNCDTALAYKPDYAPALVLRSQVRAQLRHYDLAIADLDQAIAIEPRNGNLFGLRATLHALQHNDTEALADADKGLAIEPNNIQLLIERAELHVSQGDTDQAISDFQQVIALKPDSAGAHSGLANAWVKKDDAVQALAEFKEAIRLDPQSAAPWTNRGRFQFNRGDFQSAASDLAQAVTREKGSDAYTLLWLYLARFRAGQNGRNELAFWSPRLSRTAWPVPVVEFYLGGQTIPNVLAAAHDNDENCEAQFYIGEWLILQKLPAQAVAPLTKAVEICPKSFVEYNGALDELKRIRKTVPPSARAPALPSLAPQGRSQLAKDRVQASVNAFVENGPDIYTGHAIWKAIKPDRQLRQPGSIQAQINIDTILLNLTLELKPAPERAAYLLDLQIATVKGGRLADSFGAPIFRGDKIPDLHVSQPFALVWSAFFQTAIPETEIGSGLDILQSGSSVDIPVTLRDIHRRCTLVLRFDAEFKAALKEAAGYWSIELAAPPPEGNANSPAQPVVAAPADPSPHDPDSAPPAAQHDTADVPASSMKPSADCTKTPYRAGVGEITQCPELSNGAPDKSSPR